MRPLAWSPPVAVPSEVPMNGWPRPLRDESLFGLSDSGFRAAAEPAALPYHSVFRGLPSLLPLQHYLICIADSARTTT